MNPRIVLGALCMFWWCSRVSALDPSLDLTQYIHTAWTARDGLKGSTRSIVQTPDGYLWIGTEFGLVRFDGVRFVPWSPPPGEGLPSPNILALVAGRDGTLWIGTLEGLASWKDGRLINYPEIRAGAFALLEDHDGTVWVGAGGRLCSIRGSKTECHGINGSSGTGLFYLYGNEGAGVTSLYEDSDRRLWAGTESGLWKWNPGPPERYLSEPMDTQQAIVQGDAASGLIFGSGSNHTVRQLSGHKIEKYAVPGVLGPLKAPHLLHDRDGALWIGTYDQGVLRVSKGKTSRFALGEGLSSNLVSAFFEDREGSIWVGTTNGLDRFREPAVSTLSAHQGLRSPVWSVLPAHDGSLWIGYFEGLQRWSQGQLTIYHSASSSEKQFGRLGAVSAFVRETTAAGLPDDYIGSLYEDRRGRVWITTGKGVAWFENGSFTRASGLPAGSANAIIADENDGVWISYPAQGLFHVAHGTVVQSIPWPWSSGGTDLRLSAVVPDSAQGGLWLGTVNAGIGHFKDGKVSTWLGNKDGLGADLVWNLHVDHEGTLWAATEGGLSRIQEEHVSTLTTKNGLPCNAVHWVIEDDARSLWLSTACGLLRIGRSDLQAWVSDSKSSIHPALFDGSDGFTMHAMLTGYSPVVKKSADGKLWFAHNDGVSVIDPQNLRLNKLAPPVHVEELKVDGNLWDASHGWRLPALTRDLEIHYTALSLVAPEKNRFKYKLEGRDSDWKDAGNERKASYTDLPPRNYRFRVMASNNNGVWNEAGDSLDFSIAPAYYQTTWFQASCVAAFLGLVWALYRYRLHQVAREFNVRLEERVGERVRIARELHDTLLQTVQGLMLRLQVVDEMLPPGKAKEELEETLEVGDQAIIEGRNTVRDLRSPLSTNELAQAVRALGDELASGSSATFRLVVEGAVRELHPIVRDELYRIAREALRNAFAHAKARHIEAEITYEDRLLRLRIRDDGEGIPAEILDEGRSGHFGLEGMRERAKQIGSKLTIWSGGGTGTEIDVSVGGSVAYSKPPARSRFWRSGKKKVG